MPNEIPRFLFIKRALICVVKWLSQLLHFVLVAFVWLGLLPYVTVWCWRWYFYFGNTIISAIKLSQNFNDTLIQNYLNETNKSNSTYSVSVSSNLNQNQNQNQISWKSLTLNIFHDIFQGQTITCSLVVIFVVIFLLREWVLQQGPINDPQRDIDNSRPLPPLKQIIDEQKTQLPIPPNLEFPLNERQKQKKKARQSLNPLQIPNSATAFNNSDNSSQTSDTTSSSIMKQRRISDIIREDNLAHDVNVAATTPLPESPAVALATTSAVDVPSISRTSSLRSNTAAHRTNAWVTNSENEYLSPNTAFNSSAIADDHDDIDIRFNDRLPDRSLWEFNNELNSSHSNERDNERDNENDYEMDEYNHRELDQYFNPDENDENEAENDETENNGEQGEEDENENENGEEENEGGEGGIMDDELDGLFEAVGLRGPLANLFQNSSLMMLLFFIGIGCFIFLPYTIGKAFAQLHPADIILLPIKITRWFTDPLFDMIALIISKVLFPSPSSRSDIIKLPMHIRFQNYIARIIANAESWVSVQQLKNISVLRRIPIKVLKGILSFLHSLFATKSQPKSISNQSQGLQKLSDFLINLPIIKNHQKAISNVIEVFSTSVEWIRRKSWSLAIKDGTSERVMSILLGYKAITTFAAIYLNMTNNMIQVANVVREAMHQQVILAKIAVLFASELILFPLACGALLEICSMPLYPTIDFQSRIDYTFYAPITSLFTKWLCGTLLLFLVSVLITGIRKLLRPGVLWFIRDPNDPNFAPMRDVLERSALTHVRKLTFSAFLYSTFILSTFGVGFLTLRVLFTGILPLRWKINEPISFIPVDLLFLQFIMPYTLRKLAPRKLAKDFYAHWWKWASAQLGLSSFMFGGRYRREERRYRVYNWRTLFGFRQKKHEMRLGNWMRVPATDNVSFDRKRPGPMLVQVDETGYPISPEGEKAVANQLREASINGRDPAKDWCVIYAPPNLKRRLLWFVTYLWATTVSIAIFLFIPSLKVGRLVMDYILKREVHDIYCLTVGFYLVLAPPVAYQKYIRNINKSELIKFLKYLYFISFLGFGLPTLFGISVQLSIIFPFKYISNDLSFPPHLHIPESWCLGLLIGRISLFLTKNRNICQSITLINSIQNNGLTIINFNQFNKSIVLPLLLAFIATYLILTFLIIYISKCLNYIGVESNNQLIRKYHVFTYKN